MTPEHELQEVIFVKQAEELIERDVLFVEDTATVSDAEHLMQQYSIRGVPVVDKGRIIGIVSRRDVRAIVSKRGDEKITSIMTKKPIVADEDITAEKALEIMYTNKIERLPVVNNKGKLLGIITMQDILEKRQYPFATRDTKGNLRVAAAVGPFDFSRPELLDNNNVDALVVDWAHGHSQDWAEAILQRYPSGTGVPVSYCPTDPDLAALEPGIHSEGYYLPGAGLHFYCLESPL